MKPDSFTGSECPMLKKIGCNGIMKPIKGQQEAWKCTKCPTEVWTGDMPVWEKIHDGISCQNINELFKNTLGGEPAKKGGKNNSGRRRRKKTFYKRRNPLDL